MSVPSESSPEILLLTDEPQNKEWLLDLLSDYTLIEADDLTPPPPCDLVVVDAVRLRGSPLSSLSTQRQMGCSAPALLLAPRLTKEMAAELFSLNIRAYLAHPVDDGALLEILETLIAYTRSETENTQLGQQLEASQRFLEKRLDTLDALSRVGKTLAVEHDPETIFTRLVEAAIYLIGADGGIMYVLGSEGHIQSVSQKATGALDATTLDLGSRPEIQTTFQTGHHITAGDDTSQLLCIPLIQSGRPTGVLALIRIGDEAFDRADQVIGSYLTDYAAIALDQIADRQALAAESDRGFELARLVTLHAETLHDPIEGVESLVDTLLSDGFDPLTEKQRSAINRIRLASIRMKEIFSLINQEIDEALPPPSSSADR